MQLDRDTLLPDSVRFLTPSENARDTLFQFSDESAKILITEPDTASQHPFYERYFSVVSVNGIGADWLGR